MAFRLLIYIVPILYSNMEDILKCSCSQQITLL